MIALPNRVREMDKEVSRLHAVYAYSARLLRTYLHLFLKLRRPTC